MAFLERFDLFHEEYASAVASGARSKILFRLWSQAPAYA